MQWNPSCNQSINLLKYLKESERGAFMIHSEIYGKKLSLLGFGAMRLPEKNGTVDEQQVEEMVAYAMEHGVNYFDTAYPYHGGMSERVMGKVLSKYPRDSFYLADKYPGHQIMEKHDPAGIFEEQLRRCGVEYFDFYLLHNVYEKSLETYLDPQLGILDYFREQKRLGRIRHLGFSSHGRLELVERFLDICGDDMEFCQIQLNYLDWTLQNGREKYALLEQRGIPVWVMEPVRGGKLANFTHPVMQEMLPDASTASWGFRFLQGLPNVKMILSGMSNMAQVKDNVHTFEVLQPLTKAQTELVFQIAEDMKNVIPCTGCRYCCDGCPKGLNIPAMMSICSDIRFAPVVNSVMMIQALPDEKKPAACIACGKCTKICPQGIDIPAVMKELSQRLEKIPNWADICREREAQQKKNT